MFLALIPISLFEACSVSPDALTNGLSFLFVSMVVKSMLEREWHPFSGQGAVLIFIGIALSLCKPGYAILLLMVLLILLQGQEIKIGTMVM